MITQERLDKLNDQGLLRVPGSSGTRCAHF